MRRLLVLLSLAAAAAGLAAPAAHAEPMCSSVWIGGASVPQGIGPYQGCVNYPYGQYCEFVSEGLDPDAGVDVTVCVPSLV